jgi:hypothetical protein
MHFFLARLTLTAVIAATGMAGMGALANTGVDAGIVARHVLRAPDVSSLQGALWRIGYLYLCYASVGLLRPWLRAPWVSKCSTSPQPVKNYRLET